MGSSDAGRIVDYLNQAQPEMVDLLGKLVLAESPSNEPDSQVHCLSILLETLQTLDYQVELVRGRQTGGHLLARPVAIDEEAPRQLLLGHCDTVWPIGTLKRMPFVVDGNIAQGPGVYDMKGGLVQMVFALKALRALNLRPTIAPYVFVNSDEEIGSHESGIYIRALARDTRRVFVLEPSLGLEGKLKTARKGVGRFCVEVTGVAAHAGLDPEKGRSAILELSHVIQKLFDLNDLETGVSVNVGTVAGGLRPNVVAPTSTAEVDVRVPTREHARLVEAAVLGLKPVTDGVQVRITGQIDREPLERTPANQALWRMAERAARNMAVELDHGMAGGASDGNITSQITATLDGLGAVGDGAHADHEFIYLDKMVERSALLGLLLLAEDSQVASRPG